MKNLYKCFHESIVNTILKASTYGRIDQTLPFNKSLPIDIAQDKAAVEFNHPANSV